MKPKKKTICLRKTARENIIYYFTQPEKNLGQSVLEFSTPKNYSDSPYQIFLYFPYAVFRKQAYFFGPPEAFCSRKYEFENTGIWKNETNQLTKLTFFFRAEDGAYFLVVFWKW